MNLKRKSPQACCVILGLVLLASCASPTSTPATDSTHKWQAITCSSGGDKIAACDEHYVYLSKDSGASWSKATADLDIWGVAMSSDGSVLAASQGAGHIYVSMDGGSTWTAKYGDSSLFWLSDVYLSPDGTTIIGSTPTFGVYISTDSGNSWNTLSWKILDVSITPADVAFSPGGSTLYMSSSFQFARSTDGWSTSTSISMPSGVSSPQIACSTDGSKIILADYSGYIYSSTDAGNTWSEHTISSSNWTGLCASADCSTIAACANTVSNTAGYIFVSQNSGNSWSQALSAGKRQWTSIACSYDGTRIYACSADGHIFSSADSGST